jgi:hypothetical protein
MQRLEVSGAVRLKVNLWSKVIRNNEGGGGGRNVPGPFPIFFLLLFLTHTQVYGIWYIDYEYTRKLRRKSQNSYSDRNFGVLHDG